jgi:hypothetical protein
METRLLLDQWWLSLKLSVTSSIKGYGKSWSPIPGSHEEPQLELEGYLRAIMLESYLAGDFLCPMLLTFEPKVVKKVSPGAERSILRSGGSSSEALLGAMESILGQKRLSLKLVKLILELCRLILEPLRITLEPWKLYLDHLEPVRVTLEAWRLILERGGSPWSHRNFS